MLDRPLVFVDVDTQRDFLEPGGALFLPGSEALHPNLRRLTEFARRAGIPVIATACAHTEADVEEIDRFGRHCMVGTPGEARIEATSWEGGLSLRPTDCLVPGPESMSELPAHLTLKKRTYDVFSHPEAARIMAAYNRHRPTFVVYGVATDFCVHAAVMGLLSRGYKVAVVVDAVHAIDAANESEVLGEFTAAGAVLTTTDAVCGG